MPTAGPPPDTGQPLRNAQFPWDDFAPEAYRDHNYTALRQDDAQILGFVGEWFASAAAGRPRDALDVGAGPNLYPALAMLPFARTVTLREYSAANVRWLRGETARLGDRWGPFWRIVSPGDRFGDFVQARDRLARCARVEQGSVFDLPQATWDLGTMFFVAESISPDPAEFTAAVHRFVRALRPGSPFAAAFMEQSAGYEVAGVRYPATPVGVAEITAALEPVASEPVINRIEMSPAPLRPGYTGMVLAIGLAK